MRGDVKLPGNYLLLYGRMDATDALLASGEDEIAAAAEAVLGKIERPARRPSQTIAKVHNDFMEEVPGTALAFSVTDACTGCGLCVSLCPAGNIALSGGRPAFSNHCERCMSCLQCCPNRAIDHPNGIASRERYRHPAVTLQQLIDRNR